MPHKALIKRISIDTAERAHRCRSNKNHLIARGDKRLKIIEGRAKMHYCIACAKKFIAIDTEKLNNIASQL